MTDQDLKLQVGDTLQLQFGGDDPTRRYYTRVIGYLPGKSLIITTPKRDGKVMMVREGQTAVARLASGNAVYAFNARVLISSLKPYPYLHLSYPKELEHIVVRRAHRTRANLVGTVQTEGANEQTPSRSATIVDISTTGALILCPERIGEVEDLITVSTRLTVGEVTEYLTLPAVIRSVREDKGEGGRVIFAHGVEFKILDQHDSVVLHGYVYERLIKG
jgi:c-di-GMP-binding flagellar brake protein YcgR